MPRWLIGVLTAGLLATALAWLAGPTPPRLSPAATGDPELEETVRAAIADPTGYRGLAVAMIEPEGVRFAGLGERDDGAPVAADTAFEVGSIGKTLTGMLLADLAAAGTVDPEEPLSELLADHDFADPALAQTTPEELASHRSGLPPIRITGPAQVLGTHFRTLRGDDPYRGQHTEWLLSTVESAGARGGEPEVRYSNYGMAVLGHALAERAGTAYPELLRQRVLDPLGMADSTFHLDGADLPAQHTNGGTAGGRPMAPWQASGYAPAGIGLWSTAEDLATLVSAMLAETAPGADAATPRFPSGPGERVGYGWFTDDVEGRELTWHNGRTGGFGSFVGYLPDTGHGVVVLSNTDRPVEDLGRHLLLRAGTSTDDPAEDAAVDGEPAADGEQLAAGGGPDWLAVVITIFVTFYGGLGLLFTATRPATDRLRLFSNGVWALALPAFAYSFGSWDAVWPLVWALGVGLAVVAAALAARRWRPAPVRLGRYPWVGWASAGLNTGVVVAVMIWYFTSPALL